MKLNQYCLSLVALIATLASFALAAKPPPPPPSGYPDCGPHLFCNECTNVVGCSWCVSGPIKSCMNNLSTCSGQLYSTPESCPAASPCAYQTTCTGCINTMAGGGVRCNWCELPIQGKAFCSASQSDCTSANGSPRTTCGSLTLPCLQHATCPTCPTDSCKFCEGLYGSSCTNAAADCPPATSHNETCEADACSAATGCADCWARGCEYCFDSTIEKFSCVRICQGFPVQKDSCPQVPAAPSPNVPTPIPTPFPPTSIPLPVSTQPPSTPLAAEPTTAPETKAPSMSTSTSTDASPLANPPPTSSSPGNDPSSAAVPPSSEDASPVDNTPVPTSNQITPNPGAPTTQSSPTNSQGNDAISARLALLAVSVAIIVLFF